MATPPNRLRTRESTLEVNHLGNFARNPPEIFSACLRLEAPTTARVLVSGSEAIAGREPLEETSKSQSKEAICLRNSHRRGSELRPERSPTIISHALLCCQRSDCPSAAPTLDQCTCSHVYIKKSNQLISRRNSDLFSFLIK